MPPSMERNDIEVIEKDKGSDHDEEYAKNTSRGKILLRRLIRIGCGDGFRRNDEVRNDIEDNAGAAEESQDNPRQPDECWICIQVFANSSAYARNDAI